LPQRRLSEDERQGFTFEGSLFVQKYLDLTRNDIASLSGGISYLTPLNSYWDNETALHTDLSLLDGRAFTTTTRLHIQGRRYLSQIAKLNVSYEIAHIDALDNQYDYLNGWRNRIELRPDFHWQTTRLRLAYRFEWNDRTDRATPRFSSFSAVRHRFRARVSHEILPGIRLSAGIRYRISRYRDPDEIATAIFQRRSEDRLRLSLSASKRLEQGRELALQIDHTDNDSNVPKYSYVGNTIMVNLLLPW